MSNREPTLRDILLPEATELPEYVWSPLEAARPVKELREKVLALAPGFAWGPEAARISSMVFELLNIGIFRNALVKVWNESGLFRKYLDRDSYAPEETIEVTLADHTITSRHHPRIELLLNGDPVYPIVLDLTVTITVRGAVIEIQDGKIKRVRTGELRGAGDLKWEGYLLASEKLRPIPLPGTREFGGGGIPILA